MKARRSLKGSAPLITVLILTAVAAMTAAALITYTVTERKLNRHELLRLQAQDAAESVLEYGSSQIAVKFLSQSGLPSSFLSSNHITLYSSRGPTFFSSGTQTNNYVTTSSFSLWASQIGSQGQYTIDPNDPANANDPLQGQTVTAQTVRLLSKATATDSNGNSVTDYATQQIEVRDTSLFRYAIFYNIPMEFHPGARMDIYGPVFSNQDVYLTETDPYGMAFHSTFDTAGKFHATSLYSGTSGNSRPTGQNIYFTNGLTGNVSNQDGDTLDFYDISSPTISGVSLGTYVDSLLNQSGASNQSSTLPTETFSQAASQLWKGYVQDQSMDVQTQNPPGILDSTTAHKLIEPPDPTLSTDSSASNYSAVEAEKFSNKAGLYIVVEPNADSSATGAVVYGFTNSSDALSYEYSNTSNKTKRNTSARASWISSNPGKAINLSSVVNTQRLFYDAREGKALNTVDIDVGALRTAVGTSGNSTLPYAGSSSYWDGSSWTGTVYVDVQNDTADSNASDGTTSFPSGWQTTSDVGVTTTSHGTTTTTYISGTGSETAVRLEDASSLPSRGSQSGFSIATNAPLYIVGTYNANGTLEGGSSPTSTQVMTPDSNEVPAMVAGDSINILSSAWWSGSKPTGDTSVTNTNGTGTGSDSAANDTEIAAAFLTGNVPTSNSGSYSYSGGVENYMRFSENWSGVKLRYRGSIVALFNSKVALGQWKNAVYSPPTRQWGYDNEFTSATGGYPPGTPYLRTLRRIGYQDLTSAVFNTMLADTNYNFVQMN